MKIMPCPLNGPRNISEFTYGGEFKPMPDPATCSDAEWAECPDCDDQSREAEWLVAIGSKSLSRISKSGLSVFTGKTAKSAR